MNGKVVRMLRKMRRSSKADKRIWNELTPEQRGAIRWAHKNNDKLMHIDFLPTAKDRI